MTMRLPLVLTPADGPYAAIVRAVDETVGVALVEVYDLDLLRQDLVGWTDSVVRVPATRDCREIRT
jgi:hypothetical protein